MKNNLQNNKSLENKIDWVSIANIKRNYPNEVKIFITEHLPVAIWNNDYYLIDQKT